MTINKSQGQTFERVGINLLKPVFGHGQLYVAFSRCRRRRNVAVLMPKVNEWGKYNRTKNVVYEQVLARM
jgi:ATP-dependent exoDNAse (exonuclease V) alpha subunit